MQLRPHTFLGTTQSLCPECLSVVPAKIIVKKNGRVYFRKQCPTHGFREDFVCSDVKWYDRTEYMVPGKVPPVMGVEPDKGCPYDCGLCTEHEQHTCIALVEITSSCNLQCPMCYSSSGPGGKHLTFEEACRAIDRIVQTEQRPEIIQLSGGEPTIHPEFERIFAYACEQPVDYVMINTNGLRFAHDPALLDRLAERKRRMEVYLQFDGFSDSTSRALRGESLVETKLKAIEALGQHGIHTILVVTLQPGVNDGEMGAIVKFALERPWITGVSFQPATYSGRHVLPDVLERRITFPDVVKGIAAQTEGLFREQDFMPLPCAHPNCHILTYAYRTGSSAVPLTRFIDPQQSLDLLANGITFTRPRARQLIETYLNSLGCCASGSCDEAPVPLTLIERASSTRADAAAGVAADRSSRQDRLKASAGRPVGIDTTRSPLSRDGRGVGGVFVLPETLAPPSPTLPPRGGKGERIARGRTVARGIDTDAVRPQAAEGANVIGTGPRTGPLGRGVDPQSRGVADDEHVQSVATEFFAKALSEQLSPRDVFRITITSFLDPYNFDLRRLMKCCIHHVLPSGHVIPFCAYNVLYREGHVPLPPLRDGAPSGGVEERQSDRATELQSYRVTELKS